MLKQYEQFIFVTNEQTDDSKKRFLKKNISVDQLKIPERTTDLIPRSNSQQTIDKNRSPFVRKIGERKPITSNDNSTKANSFPLIAHNPPQNIVHKSLPISPMMGNYKAPINTPKNTSDNNSCTSGDNSSPELEKRKVGFNNDDDDEDDEDDDEKEKIFDPKFGNRFRNLSILIGSNDKNFPILKKNNTENQDSNSPNIANNSAPNMTPVNRNNNANNNRIAVMTHTNSANNLNNNTNNANNNNIRMTNINNNVMNNTNVNMNTRNNVRNMNRPPIQSTIDAKPVNPNNNINNTNVHIPPRNNPPPGVRPPMNTNFNRSTVLPNHANRNQPNNLQRATVAPTNDHNNNSLPLNNNISNISNYGEAIVQKKEKWNKKNRNAIKLSNDEVKDIIEDDDNNVI